MDCLSSSVNRHARSDKLQPDSCVTSLLRSLRTRNLSISPEGQLFKILSVIDYKNCLLKICALVMLGFFAHIIKLFPYHHITIIGNTVYSRVAAATLEKCRVPFVICKDNNRISYYETTDDQEIAFEGPSTKFFTEVQSASPICLIPHTINELNNLEAHTNLKNFNCIQNVILSGFPNIDGIHIVKANDLVYKGKFMSPVIQIKKFFGDLYYVMTTTEIWLSRIIITDNALPLQPGEVISGLFSSKIDDPPSPDNNKSDNNKPTKYKITRTADGCSITEANGTINLIRQDCYSISTDLTINPILSKNLEQKSSLLYNLSKPRSFNNKSKSLSVGRAFGQNNIYTIHPFYLPISWDPFLTIMIVTRGLILNNVQLSK